MICEKVAKSLGMYHSIVSVHDILLDKLQIFQSWELKE